MAVASLLTCAAGLMMTGFVHNPKFLVIGLGFITANQFLTFWWGYSKGRKR
jgi:hypothetical protein